MKVNIQVDLRVFLDGDMPLFEIMSGDHTRVAAGVLESTIAEAGLGIPVIHEKYGYCHGRSTLQHVHRHSCLIFIIVAGCENLYTKAL